MHKALQLKRKFLWVIIHSKPTLLRSSRYTEEWRIEGWNEYSESIWKSSILKISISFLTMIWLIFLELNDVFKPSTYPKGLNHKPTTLSTVIFWIRMKTHSMESPQAFLDASRLSSNPTDRVRTNAVIKYHL